MRTLILVVAMIGMNVAVRATDPKPILGNDGHMNRQSVFPDSGQTNRFGPTNRIQHGSSVPLPGTGTSSVMTNLSNSTTNQLSSTNGVKSTADQPADTNAPYIRTITP